jgi:serine/threonine protein kinase
MSIPGAGEDLVGDGESTEAIPTIEPAINHVVQRRVDHRAAFESTLKEVFLRYRVQLREPIGEHSKETVVYRGLFQGRRVAVKIFTAGADVLHAQVGAYGAFKVECEKTKVLSQQSQHVVEVLDYGDTIIPEDMPEVLRQFFPLGLIPFMITELAEFGSLDSVMKNYLKMPGFDRLSLLEAVIKSTEGLVVAHAHGVAHRDIKPQNILIFGPSRGKIADFGIARWRTAFADSEATMLTPRYASPEQALTALTGAHDGDVGRTSDIYSWAIMVYEIVTNKHPFYWATKGHESARATQRAVLQAIADNDRRGFQPTGDITFDSLIAQCTCDREERITNLKKANQVLSQLVKRLRLDFGSREQQALGDGEGQGINSTTEVHAGDSEASTELPTPADSTR